MHQVSRFALLAAICSVAACHSSNSGSQVNEITGRTSMGKRDPFQCYNLSYSGDEQVNGKWIAGADGTTFGSMQNGVISSQCGKVFTIRNKKTGQSAEFILVDRIWENDGVNGRRYNNEHNAKIKSGDIGPGYEQIDIAVAPFNSLFGGHNPKDGDFEIIGLGSGSGSLSGGQSQNQPSGGGSGQAANGYPVCTNGSNNGDGWGWDEAVTDPKGTHSCVVAGSSGASQSASNGSKAGKDEYPYCTNGSNNGDGWGWDEAVTDPNGSHSCLAR